MLEKDEMLRKSFKISFRFLIAPLRPPYRSKAATAGDALKSQ
jgi:hypothetical protein